MKVLIIYSHPYDKSFCHAIMESVKKSALKAGHEVEVLNLDEDGFNPVMTGEDLLGFRNHEIVDEQAKAYAAKVRAAEHLVFIFPVWWELMPAMMKGFIDKVIFPGTTYEYTRSGYGMKSILKHQKKTTVITTMNTPKPVYKFIFGNPLRGALIKGTFKKTGMKNVEWISFHMVKASSEKTRKKWLHTAGEIFVQKKRRK